MEKTTSDHAGSISIIAFVIAVGVSLGYYQFVFVPEANKRPILPDQVLNPAEMVKVQIAPGASLESNKEFYVPAQSRGVLGISNKVVWTNNDSIAHTVTSDDGYVDRISGPFNSLEQQEQLPGGYLNEGQTFEFTFTRTGEYHYHCVPHPHMQGMIEIVENFS